MSMNSSINQTKRTSTWEKYDRTHFKTKKTKKLDDIAVNPFYNFYGRHDKKKCKFHSASWFGNAAIQLGINQREVDFQSLVKCLDLGYLPDGSQVHYSNKNKRLPGWYSTYSKIVKQNHNEQPSFIDQEKHIDKELTSMISGEEVYDFKLIEGGCLLMVKLNSYRNYFWKGEEYRILHTLCLLINATYDKTHNLWKDIKLSDMVMYRNEKINCEFVRKISSIEQIEEVAIDGPFNSPEPKDTLWLGEGSKILGLYNQSVDKNVLASVLLGELPESSAVNQIIGNEVAQSRGWVVKLSSPNIYTEHLYKTIKEYSHNHHAENEINFFMNFNKNALKIALLWLENEINGEQKSCNSVHFNSCTNKILLTAVVQQYKFKTNISEEGEGDSFKSATIIYDEIIHSSCVIKSAAYNESDETWCWIDDNRIKQVLEKFVCIYNQLFSRYIEIVDDLDWIEVDRVLIDDPDINNRFTPESLAEYELNLAKDLNQYWDNARAIYIKD